MVSLIKSAAHKNRFKVLVTVWNKFGSLIRAFSVIVKTDGSFAALIITNVSACRPHVPGGGEDGVRVGGLVAGHG